MDFIVNNIGNIVIIVIVLLICGLSLANIIKKKIEHIPTCGCGCGCSGTKPNEKFKAFVEEKRRQQEKINK